MKAKMKAQLFFELGGIAVYLASNASSYAMGGVFVIDGGYMVW